LMRTRIICTCSAGNECSDMSVTTPEVPIQTGGLSIQ
jgi:hypothetical protein